MRLIKKTGITNDIKQMASYMARFLTTEENISMSKESPTRLIIASDESNQITNLLGLITSEVLNLNSIEVTFKRDKGEHRKFNLWSNAAKLPFEIYSKDLKTMKLTDLVNFDYLVIIHENNLGVELYENVFNQPSSIKDCTNYFLKQDRDNSSGILRNLLLISRSYDDVSSLVDKICESYGHKNDNVVGPFEERSINGSKGEELFKGISIVGVPVTFMWMSDKEAKIRDLSDATHTIIDENIMF